MKFLAPLSAVPSQLVYDYFERFGLPGETVRWKYYDEAFNRGRERGWIWRKQGEVRGFIGMIPFTAATPSGDREMVWTCDWGVEDPGRNPGIGVMLLKQVYGTNAYAAALGGSKFTHAIVPRMASHVVEEAATTLHLPLCLGFALEKLESRARYLPKLSRTPLKSMPLRFGQGEGSARIEDGVSPALAALFDRPSADVARPRYSHADLDWRVGRAPGIRAFSFTAGSNDGALLWSRRDDPRSWRVAFVGRGEALGGVAQAVARRARDEGAWAVSTLVSHRDADILAAIRQAGYLKSPARSPLYLSLGEGADPPISTLAGLSYLDTDLPTPF